MTHQNSSSINSSINSSSGRNEAGSTTISWKNRLQEFCHQRGWNLPVYTTRQNSDRMWISTVAVNNISVSGEAFQRKVDSEKSASFKLLSLLANLNEDVIAEDTEELYITDMPELNRLFSEIMRSAGFNESLLSSSVPSSSSSSSVPSSSSSDPSSDPLPDPLPDPSSGNRIETILQRQLTFSTNIFDETFLNHLTLLVRGKNVEITNVTDYKSDDAPVVLYLLDDIDSITSNFININLVEVTIPRLDHRESFQAMILLSMCMELGADSCSIIGVPAGQVNRVILT